MSSRKSTSIFDTFLYYIFTKHEVLNELMSRSISDLIQLFQFLLALEQ